MAGGAGSGRDAVWALLDEAADLGPGRALTGESVPAKLPCAAAAQERGLIGGDHVRTIRWFFAHLPGQVDLGTRIDAERELARLATQFGPEHFRKAAERMMTVIDQDGQYRYDGSPRINQCHHPEHPLLPEEDDSG